MGHQLADGHDEGVVRCAVCWPPVADARGGTLSAYWVIIHDNQVARLCSACHTPDHGGVYVVIPATRENRWVPLVSGRAYSSRRGGAAQAS